MHFFYLDEAGCTGAKLNDPNQPIFTLGGISVSDEKWMKTNGEFFELLKSYFTTIPHNFELHASELLAQETYYEDWDRKKINDFVFSILNLVEARGHALHIYGIDKPKLHNELNSPSCTLPPNYEKSPYLLYFDYLVKYVDKYISSSLGKSARGLFIIDEKDIYHKNIDAITQYRRYDVAKTHRIRRIAEFTYPVDSKRNAMIQISDLIVYICKKFFEIEGGYRNGYSPEIKQFYFECYNRIISRTPRSTFWELGPSTDKNVNHLLKVVSAIPSGQWRKRYET